MKRLYIVILCFLVGITFSFVTNNEAFAAKKNKSQETNTIKALSNDGETTLYGSVLNPNDDEVIIPLSKKNLTNIRNIGLDKISIILTSTLDSTKTYTVADDAFSIQRKKINNKNRKSLVVSLFNLTTQSGVIISPSALPAGTYKLRITGNGLDITTDAINYETPSLIVGRVDSETTGIVSVEDLKGNIISERTVVTSPDGTFFTEVRANKLSNTTKVRRYLRAQALEGEETDEIVGEEEIDTGVVHCATNIDQYAIVSLKNDANKNTERTNNPVEVNETSTLTANLAKENEELAAEIASASDVSSSTDDTDEEDDFNFTSGPGCDIEQFAHRCNERSGNNDELFASIGADFREFLKIATCRFPEFKLIKLIILAAPDEINVHIGRGYCEHARREVNDDKPCLIYERILTEYKKGFISELPCPPYHCERFSDIRPPRCVEPIHVCGDPEIFNGDPCHSDDPNFNGFTGPNGKCITEPVDDDFDDNFILARSPQDDRCIRHEKDLYCKRIGIDTDASECRDSEAFNNRFRPGWVVVKNSKGNEYCVPSNIPKPQFPAGFNGPFPPTTPEEIAEECELHECHKNCEEEFGFSVPPPIIDFPSDRPGEFPEPTSDFAFFTPHPDFTEHKCPVCDCHFACDGEFGKARDCGNPRSKYFHIDCCNSRSIFFQTTLSGQSTFAPNRPGRPIPHDQYSCVCEDKSNFNEKGYLKEDVIDSCENNCPEGYEKDLNSESCLPICPEGSFRDPGGICRAKCPKGSFSNEFGQCQCPPGLEFSKGQCIPARCPEHCKNLPLVRKLLASHDGTGFGSTPGGFGSGSPGSPATGYGNSGFVSSIPPECKPCFGSQISCPDNQYLGGDGICRCNSDGRIPGPEGCKQGNKCGNSNMLPNPKANEPNQAQCICPPGLLYWDPIANSCAAVCSQGQVPSSSSNSPQNSPIPCQSTNQCPPSLPVKCPDGSCVLTTAGCGTQNNYCPPGIAPTATNSCICNPAGGSYFNSIGYCTCPSGSNSPYTKETGCSSTARPCTAGEGPSNGCYCFGIGFTGSDGKCQCAGGIQYTGGGCGTSSTNHCGPNITAGTGNPPCSCPPGATATGINGSCQCTNGQPYNGPASCSSTTRFCTLSEMPNTNNCTCAPGATSTTGITPCICTNGQPYTVSGCGSTSTNYCSPAIVPTVANPCTCNPAGGSYFSSSNTCTCPTNSGPYTKETGCTGSSTRPCTAGEGPSNGCYCFGSGFVGSDGKCQCTGSIHYTGGGCGTSSTNYCSPGIVPTATNPCTCNPTGGSYFSSSNTCTCPTNSGPYTKETGCTGSSTRPCTAGEGPSNGCYCFGTGFTGSDGKCQCSGGIQYTGGGCGTTTNYCALGISTTTGCTCASGATPSGANSTCQCTNGQVYASGGCPISTTHYCTPSEMPNTNNCTCATGATSTTGITPCICTNGQPYTVSGCGSTTTCSGGQILDPATNTCRCPNNLVLVNGTCQCGTGFEVDPNSPNNCRIVCNSPKVRDSTGACVCPVGQEPDPANPTTLCRQACKSEQTRDSAGICQCPVGRQNDPASSTGCSACPACTGGKVFGTSGCGCVCPSGTTENSNGNCV